MIKLFQIKKGLKPDGIIGPITAKAVRDYFKLSNEQAAHFLGQGSIETSNFTRKRERGNYTEAQLLKHFSYYKKRPNEAKADAGKEVVIFNKVYADVNRSASLKLGNTQLGDGYKFRGNAAGQLTGRFNHQAFANHVKDQRIMLDPDIVWKDYYFESFDFFLRSNNVYSLMQGVGRATCDKVTAKINGPAKTDAEKRYQATQKFYLMLIK